jgi:threonine aldolase
MAGTTRASFASDNHAGVHPEVMAAVVAQSQGHAPAYGADDATRRLQQVIQRHFGADAVAFPVFNGTGANLVALQAMTKRWESVICHHASHANNDEGSAPETSGGIKLLTVGEPAASSHGKLRPEDITAQLWRLGVEHHPQPRVVSVSQSTELGVVYTPDELADLADTAHRHGLTLHVDGARLSNAAASVGTTLGALTTDVGVDVVSLGGTKNGLMMAEAVVVLNHDAVEGMTYLRKTSMQLASKMRFISAQLLALYEEDLWLRNATHANHAAQRLARLVGGLPGLSLTHPTAANAVFATLPPPVTAALQRDDAFYVWDQQTGEVRWMCAFDTPESEVDRFAAAIRDALLTTPRND